MLLTRVFVLRHLARGYGPEVLGKTLRADELRRSKEKVVKELVEHSGESSHDALLEAAAACYDELSDKISGKNGKISQGERKRLERERHAITNEYPGGARAFEVARSALLASAGLRSQIDDLEVRLRMEWDEATGLQIIPEKGAL